MGQYTIHEETREHNGLTFKVEHVYDLNADAPWDAEDGHGPVSKWRHEDSKRAGERVLHRDRRSCLFYDFAEAVKIAKRDGWGLSEERLGKLARRLGRDPKPGEVRAEAVEADFERLRAYCDNEWTYIGVAVVLLDANGRTTHETASLWGIESDAGDYLEEVARDLMEEVADRIGDAPMLCVPLRKEVLA